MSKRLAQNEDTRSVAKSRPVRKPLCLLTSHGKFRLQAHLTLDGRDSERETNNPDSNVRKSQHSDADKKENVLLSTEKSDGTKYEDSELPALPPPTTRRGK